MIQNRQKQKRAFTGMVGRPYEPDPVPAPVAARKPGRPPIHGEAMTQAERKSQSRERQREKLADAERRDLVAQLMKIYKREQPDIVALSNKTDDISAITTARGQSIQRLRQLRGDLLQLPVEALRETLSMKRAVPDTHGRLSGERSGEAERRYGMSELERIIAVQYGEDVSATDSSEHGETGESSGPRGREYVKEKDRLEQREREEVISGLAERLTYEISETQLGCRLCPAIIQPSDASGHFWKEYMEGRKLYDRYELLVAVSAPEDMLDSARAAYLDHKHLGAVGWAFREHRREKRAAKREARQHASIMPKIKASSRPAR